MTQTRMVAYTHMTATCNNIVRTGMYSSRFNSNVALARRARQPLRKWAYERDNNGRMAAA